MPIFTKRLEAKLKELGVLEKAKMYTVKDDPDGCDNRDISSIGCAFPWGDTEERAEFWNDIENKTERWKSK
jgi:hypothetical protein